jgi:hypothetical protein
LPTLFSRQVYTGLVGVPIRAIIATTAALSAFCLQAGLAFQVLPAAQAKTYDAPFNPTTQTAIAADKDDVHILVATCSNCGDSAREVILNGTKRVALTKEIKEVDEIHIIDAAKAFVVGRYAEDVSVITLLDLVNGAAIDSFRCHYPTVSPDGSRVAYVKHFTPHFVEGVTNEYLAYDSTLTPAQNRAISVVLNDLTNVGIPLYPVGSLNVSGDVEGQPVQHRMTSDGFFWSPDSRSVAFTDATPGNGLNMAVIADFSTSPPRVSAALVPESTSIVQCDNKDWHGHEIDAYRVRQIEFLPTGLRLSFAHHERCTAKQDSAIVHLQ